MSFTEKAVTLTIQLGKGDFGESGYNTVTLAGYRCSVRIQRANLPDLGHADVRIFGMPPSIMNQLSTLGGNPYIGGRENQIIVAAGDASGMAQIFEGTINNGYQDFTGMPEVAFVIDANAGSLDLLKPAPPTSHSSTVDAATIMKSLAAQMTPPLNFVSDGVNVKLSAPYLYGTILDQIRGVAFEANIFAEIHNGTLYIWPRNGKRLVAPTAISPQTGLVGYPSLSGVQIFDLRTLFDPTLELGAGVTLTSSLTPACGTWYAGQMTHILESMTPGGAWFSDIELWSLNYMLSQPSN